MTDHSTTNPLLQSWDGLFGLPPFSAIEPSHFEAAFEVAMADHQREIDAVADDPQTPSFVNTIERLELAGKTLRQVSSVFFNLSGADTNEALQEIERKMAPVLSRHRSSILLNRAIFDRVDTVFEERDAANLTDEQARVLERYHTMYIRAGAKLDEVARGRVSEISEQLATLGTQFSQNVLADESSYELVLDSEDDLAGLPDFLRSAAGEAARARGRDGKFIISLSRSSIEPFLKFSERRDLREEAFLAWAARGEKGGETDNREILAETLSLREERARILGFANYAEYKLDDQMAKTPARVRDLLMEVWSPARERARDEAAKLRGVVSQEGGNFEIEPWDWRYYSEKVRKAEFDIDEAATKPYFQLDRMIEAAFSTANRLFGLTFEPIEGAENYHPDVRAVEVRDASGKHVGVFLGDYFARPSKRSGAWMSGFRGQQKLAGDIRPIIVNVMNFAQGANGEPTLLTLDDARTLFHEFGHALHGLMSDVTYPFVSGTSVARDFVELPSQLFEHWVTEPEVLRKFAVHYQTGEPIPDEILERLKASENFNQGFATVEYLASAIVDLEFHTQDEGSEIDVMALEQQTLAEIGMPEEIIMRHRSPHFAHVFSGEGYAAGYYSYMWAEVMDADAFQAFEEAGDIFDPTTAARLAKTIYSAGGGQDPADAYIAFRGRMPAVEALLEKRGLAGEI